MTNNSRSDLNFQLPFPTLPLQPPPPTPNVPPSMLPSSLSPSTSDAQNARRKRSKIVKIEQTEPGASSSSSSPKRVSKPKYTRKPDPSAPKITRPCTECGKKFWSWKALFGHMRCHPEREWRGINPPPNYRRIASPVNPDRRGWVSLMSADDHEVAASLLMLAQTNDHSGDTEVACATSNNLQAPLENESVDPSSGQAFRFECGGCKKVFGSHQALGGHRASHKKVKGCFAITKSGDGSEPEHCDRYSGDVGTRESGVEEQSKMGTTSGHHKCSICSRVFASGQALGGHMRCHWDKPEDASVPSQTKDTCELDLNMPAPVEDETSASYSSGFSLDLRLGL